MLDSRRWLVLHLFQRGGLGHLVFCHLLYRGREIRLRLGDIPESSQDRVRHFGSSLGISLGLDLGNLLFRLRIDNVQDLASNCLLHVTLKIIPVFYTGPFYTSDFFKD